MDHYGSPIQTEKWWCDGLNYIHKSMPRVPRLQAIGQTYREKYLGKDQYIAIQLRLADYCNVHTNPTFAGCYHMVPWSMLWEKIEEVAKSAGVTKVFVSAPPKIYNLKDVVAPPGSPITMHFLGPKMLKEFDLSVNYLGALVEQDIAAHAQKYIYSASTQFCLPENNCTEAQLKNYTFDWRLHSAPCCKDNGLQDGRIYGESFGGNIAEERWVHGKKNINLPELIGANWKLSIGARDCTGPSPDFHFLEKAM